MKKVIAIIGSGMMGSALAFPAAENGHEVRLVGTHLDRDIIDECRRSNKHPKFDRAFPVGVKYYQIEEYREAVAGSRFRYRRCFVVRCGLVPERDTGKSRSPVAGVVCHQRACQSRRRNVDFLSRLLAVGVEEKGRRPRGLRGRRPLHLL